MKKKIMILILGAMLLALSFPVEAQQRTKVPQIGFLGSVSLSAQLAARQLRLQLHSVEVSNADKFDSAFKEATKARSGALALASSSLFTPIQKRIAEMATKNRLPAIYPRGDYVDSGGLMSYGADQVEPHKRAARIVAKILKGAKPADLPVEQPTKFEFIINLKAAKQIALAIPPNVLARADRVIR